VDLAHPMKRARNQKTIQACSLTFGRRPIAILIKMEKASLFGSIWMTASIPIQGLDQGCWAGLGFELRRSSFLWCCRVGTRSSETLQHRDNELPLYMVCYMTKNGI
jgi:hypothetical protein